MYEALPADAFEVFEVGAGGVGGAGAAGAGANGGAAGSVGAGGAVWDVAKVNHLYRRAGFGLSWAGIQKGLASGPGACVEELLGFDPEKDPFAALYEGVEGMVLFNRADAVQMWWFHRMVNTPWPMQEKMALFWHNHFATSLAKVDRAEWMSGQIDLFRRKGLGSFRTLLVEVTKDPAMLAWLDGRASRRGKPNENYAREIMELFTLGAGNYSEADIKELARAFTGWTIDGEGKGVLNARQFDDGEKTIFGKTGKFGAAEAIDVILSQPRAPRFLVEKLLREFVHPQPPAEAVEHYAGRLLALKWEIGPLMREILTSKWFYSEGVYRSRIKSPVELCVGAVFAVGGKVNDAFLRDQTAKMGQTLLYPPNVKGWDGNENWINANTVLVRFNFGMMLASQRQQEFALKSDFAGRLKGAHVATAEDLFDYYATMLLDQRVPAAARSEMIDYLNRGAKDEVKVFEVNAGTVNTKVRGLVHLLMSMPEYQLA